MKKIYSIMFAAGMGLMATSCNDMLDTVPQGAITSEQLKSADSVAFQSVLSAAYAGLEAHFYGNNEAFAGPSTNWIFDVRSDDAYKGGDGTGMEQNIHLLEVSEILPTNVSALNKWQNNYYAINRVHVAMRMIKDAGSFAGSEQYMGELKTLRAWYYFDLMRIFKRIPYFNEDASAEMLAQLTNMEYDRDQIFGFIKKDLTDAIAGLPEAKSAQGRITKTTAQAILAKVDAFTGDWAGVKENCEAIINSNQYKLYPCFGDISKAANNNGDESIFALQTSTDLDYAHINWSNLLNSTRSDQNIYGDNADDFFYGSQNLVNAFRTNPSNGLPYFDTFNDVDVHEDYSDNGGTLDPRVDYTVGRIGFPWRGYTYTMGWCRSYNVYGEYSNKKAWPDPNEEEAHVKQTWPWGANSLNFMFIRYSDIILLEAEALIETAQYNSAALEHDNGLGEDGNLVRARKLINQVRQRAADSANPSYMPRDVDPGKAIYYVGLYATAGDGNLQWTKQFARDAVRFERRLELALEGNRWFDLVRWGEDYLIKTMNKYMTEESELRSYYGGASVTASEIFLPVPQSEIDNSNGLYKQY